MGAIGDWLRWRLGLTDSVSMTRDAFLQLRKRENRSALKIAERLISMDPKDRIAWSIMAVAYKRLGDKSRAAKCRKKALKRTAIRR